MNTSLLYLHTSQKKKNYDYRTTISKEARERVHSNMNIYNKTINCDKSIFLH